jgi:phenylacetate-CoA ligase
MTVLAEARTEAWDGSGLTAHAERLTARIKDTIGISARVVIQAPGSIERSAGKAKRVVDKRPKG